MAIRTNLVALEPSLTNSPKGQAFVIEETKLATPESRETVESSDDDGRYLVVSPYTEQEHLLDLETLDDEDKLLAQALVHMKSTREDYATASYPESFNWAEVFENLRHLVQARNHTWKETSFYIVAFRSQIPPTTVYTELGELDKAAHIEATASGGFLKYWFGNPDTNGRNLATCVWRSREDARRGNVGPAHRRAAVATRNLYSNWRIDRHRLIVRDGIQSWEIVDWVDGGDRKKECVDDQ